MSNIKIFTDSTSDLSQELIKQYDISIVPLYVNFEENSFKDGVEITAEILFKKVEEYNRLPMTSAPSPSDFFKAFKPFIDQGRDILYIGLSSKLSSTIQNAHIAAREFPENRIEIIDSLNVSLGIGLLVLKAADYAKVGMNLNDISKIIQEKVSKMKVFFIIDTLEYLQKGGRCSSLQSFVGGILKIKPIIKMEEGKVVLWEKLRGKREKGIAELISKVLKDRDKIDLDRVLIAHSMCFGDAVYIKTELKAKLNVHELIIGNTGCVISSHCGPKTVGIIYMLK